MILKTLELKDFRNYEAEEAVFHEKINILTGNNAQGKTNLVEAVNLLALGKSFRARKERELVRFGAVEARVKGVFAKRGQPLTTEVRLFAGTTLGDRQPGGTSGGRGGRTRYIVDGLESASVSALLGGVYTVVFSPEDLRVVKGDPETRRRFLNRAIILLRPLYYHKLKTYQKILKTRNAVLKGDSRAAEKMLDVYDDQLAEAAAAVMTERAAYLKALSSAAAAATSRISDGSETLAVEYRPHISQIGDEYSKEAIRRVFERGRERDLFLRATETGPHRDDFAVFVSGLDLRVYGSQGQQRTAALSLRFAERELIRRETGEDAILLLDDVMSELDPGRQERLLGSFGDSQIFITAAGPFEATAQTLRAAKVIRIDGGKII